MATSKPVSVWLGLIVCTLPLFGEPASQGAAKPNTSLWSVVDQASSQSSNETKSDELVARLKTAAVNHEIAKAAEELKQYQWQLFSSKIIFFVVMALVISGIVLAAIQFAYGLSRKTIFDVQETQISFEGVKIKSQFLGVITLTLSLAFFYLYLKTVYPIRPTPEAQPVAQLPR